MNVTSQAPEAAEAWISPVARYGTHSTGTPSLCASAVPSTRGRRRHPAPSLTVASADGAGPTAIATRSLPCGVSSFLAAASSDRAGVASRATTAATTATVDFMHFLPAHALGCPALLL